MYSDISLEEYRSRAHNVWHEKAPSESARRFYGEARRAAHSRFLQIVGPAAGRSLLDVGCGLGYLLERANQAGWDVRGCDTSPHWVRLANERLGAGTVSLAEPQDLDPNERYDLICAWDVLEHVFEPLNMLRAMAERLRPGGQIFVRTPNFAYVRPLYAARRSIGHASAELGPTNHVVYFTARTLRTAMGLSGLQVVAFPSIPPPLVEVSEWAGNRLGRWSIRAKQGWSTLAGKAANRTKGSVVLTSDLDVLAEPRPGSEIEP